MNKKISSFFTLLILLVFYSIFFMFISYQSIVAEIFRSWFNLYVYSSKNILFQTSEINFSNYYDDYDWDKIIFREQSPANDLCQEIVLLKNEKEIMKDYSACQNSDDFRHFHFLFKFKKDEYQKTYSRKEAIIPIYKNGWYITADLTKGGTGSKWGSRY